MDWLSRAADVASGFKSIELRMQQMKEAADEVKADNKILIEEVRRLSDRVTALEAERKTVAVEVAAALDRALAAWEIKQLRGQLEQAQSKQIPPPNESGG